MKIINSLFLTSALFLTCASASADTVARYKAVPNAAKVKIDGTSTIHDWIMEGTIIGGWFDFDPAYPLDPAAEKPADLTPKPSAEVSIPVQSIKSGKKRMDEVMLEAMKQPEFPKITFKLAEMTPKTTDRKSGTPITFNAKGDLTIAGVTRKIEMPVTVEKLDDGKLKVVGSTPLKMTDYGIKPPAPTIALGLIKVGDDIKVSFEWVVQQK
jgi:polyisoprenoid-binding protein YceI